MTLQELGQNIRTQREASGMTIDDVAARIKISARILRSIEEGSLVGLPHAVYTKSFIRAFGTLVGCDPEELSVHLESLFPPESLDETKPEFSSLRYHPSLSYPSASRRFVTLLALLCILMAIGAGGWFVVANYGSDIVELVKKPFSAIRSNGGEPAHEPAAPSEERTSSGTAAMTNALAALMQPSGGDQFTRSPLPATPAPAIPGQPPDAKSVTSAGDSATPSVSPAPAGVGVSEGLRSARADGQNTVPLLEPAAPAVTADKAAPDAAPGGREKNEVRIVAQQPCWISSTADGVKGRGFTMKPAEVLILNYARKLELIVGNSAGVTIQHNGKTIHTSGGAWQAMTLRFPPESGERQTP